MSFKIRDSVKINLDQHFSNRDTREDLRRYIYIKKKNGNGDENKI